MAVLRVKNWASFQHYRDRSPPWIKLHRGLLDNMDYYKLSPMAAKVLPLLWLIASEFDGAVPSADVLSFRLRLPQDQTAELVQELWDAKFLEAEGAAQKPAAPAQSEWGSRHIPQSVRLEVWNRDKGQCVWCQSKENIEFDHKTPVSKGGNSEVCNIQLLCRSCNRKKRTKDAAQAEQLATQIQGSRSLEGEVEGELEREVETESTLRVLGEIPSPPVPASEESKPKRNAVPIAEIVALYHDRLPEHPRIEKRTPARDGYIRQRWREDLPTLEAWRNYFDDVRASKFLTGKVQGRDGKPPFIADLEWLTRPGNFAKIAEGKYHR